MQVTGGSGNIAIGNQNAPTSVYASHISIEPSPATQNVADSLNKIVRFLEASNPTKIQLVNARLLNWMGEGEQVLTLDLENLSSMPGYEVRTMLVAPLDPGETQSRTLLMKPVRGFTKHALDTLSVEAHGVQSIPIANVTELKRFLNFPVGYDLIGAGMDAGVPGDLIKEYQVLYTQADGSFNVDFKAMGFMVQTAYQTVFEGKNAESRVVFLYFARPVEPLSMIILPRNEKKD